MSLHSHPTALPLLDALCCPDDAGPLRLDGGTLHCARCDARFPIREGIPCLLPRRPRWTPEAIETALSERRQRDLEAAHYDRLAGLRLLSLWEIPATLQALNPQPQDRIVEAGCGTGRLTLPLVTRCRELVVLDHSLESLKILRHKLHSLGSPRIQLVQGDATQMPIRSQWADRSLSCQMLEHLPLAEMRQEALTELARVVSPGGRVAVSAYRYWPLLRRLAPREGRHSGAIFFHRFLPSEFRHLLGQAGLEVEQLTSRLLYILLATARRKDH